MDLTIGFVSKNLVTKTKFIEFRDNKIFHEFRGDGVSGKPKKKKRDFGK